MIEQEDTNLKMVIADRDRWKRTAETLSLDLGKPRYAQIEYENQGLVHIASINTAVPEVSEDLVTRLRNYDWMRDGDYPLIIMKDAADEIERIHIKYRQETFLVRRIVEAIVNRGSHPSYHDRILRKQRRLHPILWKHLDALVRLDENNKGISK